MKASHAQSAAVDDQSNAPSGAASVSSFSAVSIENFPDCMKVWQGLAASCPDAWFWHTWANMQFNLCAAEKNGVSNHSFFVMLEGEPVGIAPFLVSPTKMGDVSFLEASYYGGPMPWPAFSASVKDLAAAEHFALTELEERAKAAGVERIRLRLEPPSSSAAEREHLERAVGLKYLDHSYPSHWIELSQNTLDNVRERYRRYVKKFGPAYELSIAEGEDVTPDLEEAYFRLHVKDAGGQLRSRDSYRLQADLARNKEAFYVVAHRRQGNTVAGMLLVGAYKNAAYDNSVAVDPDRQHEYVSHLLKWRAIEELVGRGFHSYELGPRAGLPSLFSLPSEKSRGISYFKNGWDRNSTRVVAMAEKFLTSRALTAYMQAQTGALQRYFELD